MDDQTIIDKMQEKPIKSETFLIHWFAIVCTILFFAGIIGLLWNIYQLNEKTGTLEAEMASSTVITNQISTYLQVGVADQIFPQGQDLLTRYNQLQSQSAATSTKK